MENQQRSNQARSGAPREILWRPRFVSTHLDSGSRRVYLAATLLFVLIFVATLWPVHAFFSRIRPFVLGLPFSLFYLAALLIATFSVLLALFLWEGRRGAQEENDG